MALFRFKHLLLVFLLVLGVQYLFPQRDISPGVSVAVKRLTSAEEAAEFNASLKALTEPALLQLFTFFFDHHLVAAPPVVIKLMDHGLPVLLPATGLYPAAP